MLLIYIATTALAASALAVSGCGGSSTSKTDTTRSVATTTSVSHTSLPAISIPAPIAAVKPASGTPLSHAQWIARGDAVCARLNAELNASPVSSAKEFTRVLPQAAAYEEAEATQLQKLVPPPTETHDWQMFLTDTRQWAIDSARLAESPQLRADTMNGTAPMLKAIAQVHEGLARIAKHNGFKVCSIV